MPTNPIVVALLAVLTQTVALIAGFGIINNTTAGLAVSLGTAIVVLGASVYAAAHAHATQVAVATLQAARVRAGAK